MKSRLEYTIKMAMNGGHWAMNVSKQVHRPSNNEFGKIERISTMSHSVDETDIVTPLPFINEMGGITSEMPPCFATCFEPLQNIMKCAESDAMDFDVVDYTFTFKTMNGSESLATLIKWVNRE